MTVENMILPQLGYIFHITDLLFRVLPVSGGFPAGWASKQIFDGSLNHWGQVTHICISKLTIIGAHQTASHYLNQCWNIIGPVGTNFSRILIEIDKFSFKKMHLKMCGRWRPSCLSLSVLTHWGRVTHIYVSKLIIIGSDNGLSPDRRQAIIWTNARLLSIGPLRTYFNENLIKIHQFSLKKIHVKMSSAKWRPSCLGLNVLMLMWCHPCGPWWPHEMEIFSALLALCVGNSPVTGEFPSQRPVTRSFDVFFDLCLNKRMSKQSWGWWFEMPSHSLCRHCT